MILCIDKFSDFTYIAYPEDNYIEFMLNEKLIKMDFDDLDVEKGFKLLNKISGSYFNTFYRIKL